MAIKRKPAVNAKIVAKARQVLAYAQEKARTCQYSSELFNAIFSVSGKATELFPTEPERTAFTRTRESKDVYKLINMLPRPPITEVVDFQGNGHPFVTLRLPKSLHQSLLAEAAEEGVSLDQLCLSKLIAQLRKFV